MIRINIHSVGERRKRTRTVQRSLNFTINHARLKRENGNTRVRKIQWKVTILLHCAGRNAFAPADRYEA